MVIMTEMEDFQGRTAVITVTTITSAILRVIETMKARIADIKVPKAIANVLQAQ
jgi:hypothetical protein